MACEKCKKGERKIFPYARVKREGKPSAKAEEYCTNPECDDYRDVKEV